MMSWRWMMAWVLLAGSSAAGGELRLAAVFSDHMVLQREAAVPVWGWADPGATVTVTIADQTHQATADPAGRWEVRLTALAAGGPMQLTCESGAQRLQRTDVLAGEVWLCSGQSNMDLAMARVEDADRHIAASADAQLRLFKVQRLIADEPAGDLTQGESWQVCDPRTVANFSAVAYFFGFALRRELDVPVGLIHSAYGGTGAESWTSESALAGDPRLKPFIDRYRRRVEEAAAGRADPPPPRYQPAGLYNGMIAPLVPFAVRGFAWYQGESNVFRGYEYRALLPAMIHDWRARWGDAALAFAVVQLPGYAQPPRVPPARISWEELREAQLMTARSLDRVGLVVTLDLGDPVNIHPTRKQPVGERLALWALAVVHGRAQVHSGPIFREASIEGDQVILSFDHVGSGLASRDGGDVRGFVIAAKDGKFRWAADVRIDADRIIVSDPKIPQPVAVRYAWSDNPHWANLINREGLPASPFRTDDWPTITQTGADP